MQPHAPMTSSPFKSLIRLVLCSALLFGSLTLFAPSATAQEPAAAEGAAAAAHSKTMMDHFKEGGIVMYPIVACSILLVWLSVDVWLRTSSKKMSPPAQVAQIQDLFRAGDYVGAYQFCKNNPSYLNDICRIGLSYLGDGHAATEEALFNEINKTNAAIQTRINYLSVIGVCTPMIGLIGTVTGMIKAFATLGSSGVGDPSKLSAAIGEVLIATASGLFIAVPAFMMFYVLRNRLQGSMHNLQEVVTSLFRKMPYAHLKDAHVGEEEFYAAVPNWVAGGAGEAHAGEPAAA